MKESYSLLEREDRASRPVASPLSRSIAMRVLATVALSLGATPSGVSAEPRSPTSEDHGSVVQVFAAVDIDDLPVHRGGKQTASLDASVGQKSPRRESAAAGLEQMGEPGSADLVVVTRGELAKGQSLAGELGKRGIPKDVTQRIIREIRPHFDLRQSRPGHRYRIALDARGRLVDFRYSSSLEKSVYVFWDGARYVARRETAELQSRIVTMAGLVETSLYEAVRALGEDPQLADDFAEIFAWDIDFTRNVRSGDAFRVLYERLYLTNDDGEEVYIRPGRILAARYQGGVGDHAAVYFETEEGRGSYFRPDGTSVERAFLVAPLRYSRISSSFSTARRHPILKITRRHPGIDYAAKEGTQIWSVADGTVTFRGPAGDSGNLVTVRHANGYVSHYAHLSRFAEGLRVGQPVHQKQVIGYVGRTGLATGPHVCFRITKNGQYVNPLALNSPISMPLDPKDVADFSDTRDQLLAELDLRTVAASDEAL